MSPARDQTSSQAPAPPSRFRFWVMQRGRLGWIVGASLAVVSGALFCNEFLGTQLIRKSYDLPFWLRTHSPPNDIIVLQMDEDSYDELHQKEGTPWDRELHAVLLERLKAGG